MKDRFARLVNNPEYVNSEDAKVDELAIFNLERDIKLLNIGPFDSSKFNTWQQNVDTEIYKKLQQDLNLKKFLEFSQDGTATVTINMGAVEKEKRITGADADAIISDIKAAKISIGKTYLDQRLEIFEEVFEPELFEVAKLYYADPKNNLGEIDESFRTSYKMRGSVIDDLRKGKLGEPIVSTSSEDSDDSAAGSTGSQTEEMLESSDVKPPVKKPTIDERRMAAGQNDFKLSNTGIDNFVKESLKTDKNATASEIVEALEKLHEDKNLRVSEEQLSLIKSKIVEYYNPKNNNKEIKSEAKLGDGLVNWFTNTVKSVIKNASNTNVINQAKADYSRTKSSTDENKSERMSEILETLKLFLTEKNYSAEDIQKEITNIVRPVKKYNSGGLMGRS